jgi:hypothetical protein
VGKYRERIISYLPILGGSADKSIDEGASVRSIELEPPTAVSDAATWDPAAELTA